MGDTCSPTALRYLFLPATITLVIPFPLPVYYVGCVLPTIVLEFNYHQKPQFDEVLVWREMNEVDNDSLVQWSSRAPAIKAES